MQNKLVFTQALNYLFENPLDDAVGCNNKHMGSAVLLPQQLSGDLQDKYSEKFKAVGQADASSALWCPPSSVGVLESALPQSSHSSQHQAALLQGPLPPAASLLLLL